LRFIVTNRATDCNNFATQLEKKNVFRKLAPTTRKNRKKPTAKPVSVVAPQTSPPGRPRLADAPPKKKRRTNALKEKIRRDARLARKKNATTKPLRPAVAFRLTFSQRRRVRRPQTRRVSPGLTPFAQRSPFR
jgi:hypothetical protein